LNGRGESAAVSKRLYIMSISCFIAGIALLIVTAQSKYVPYHLAFIGALNILASYGITVMRKWAFYLTLFTSLVSLVFGSVTLAATLMLFNLRSLNLTNILMLLAMTLYVAFFALMLAYIIFNRSRFL